MTSGRRLVPLLAGALALSAVAVSATTAGAAPASSSRHATTLAGLPSVIPAWARTATVVGATPSDQKVYVYFALARKDVAGDVAYGNAASTPGNPLYRHWLTNDQYIARFGALPGAADAVTTLLRTLGIKGATVDPMGLGVLAPMSASQASSLFAVKFHELKHGAQTLRVPMSEPTLPASLLGYVGAVDGLTEHPLHTDHTAMVPVKVDAATVTPPLPVEGAPTAYFNASPKSDYFGEKQATDKPAYTKFLADAGTTKPYIVGGYTPAQLRGAYGVDQTSYTGKGVTIGVALFFTGADAGSDLQTFSTKFGLPFDPTPVTGTYTDVCPQSTDPVNDPVGLIGAAGEQALDIEAIHQMAPDASIKYCGAEAPENEPIYVALDTLIVMGSEAINNSYGGTGDTDAADAAVFASVVTDVAKARGVGLDYSSGDSADNVTANATREVDFPASSDSVTSVGGTLLEVGANNHYDGEAYWGTYSTPALGSATSWGTIASQAGGAGGGGGVSTAYAEPAYQVGVVPPAETMNSDTGTTQAGRTVPDVSMLGDSTTGILVGETQIPDITPTGAANTAQQAFYSYYRIGGTSVSSPLFTGMMALVDQALGYSAGFVNPTIYPFLAKYPTAFRDPSLGLKDGNRYGGTLAQSRTGCTGSANDVCTGAGPGVVPILTEVRADYTDTANDGYGTVSTDPSGLVPTTVTKGNNTVVYYLRAQSVIGTLDDLKGYDDSTGLGSPYAPGFIAAFLASPPPMVPEASAPVELVGVGAVLAVAAAVYARRRRRHAA